MWHQWCRFEKKGQLEVEFPQKSALEKYDFNLTCIEFLTGCQKLDINLENKAFQNWSYQTLLISEKINFCGDKKCH